MSTQRSCSHTVETSYGFLGNHDNVSLWAARPPAAVGFLNQLDMCTLDMRAELNKNDRKYC